MDDIDDCNDAWWHQLDQDQQYQQEMTMPKVNEMIQSKWLKKEDIEDDTICTILGVRQDNLGKEGEAADMRWVLGMRRSDGVNLKPMVLNVTSIRVLEAAYGSDSDDWKGKQVTVYVDPNVSFQGRVVGGLRLRPVKAQKAASKPTPAQDFEDSLDEIPF